MKKKLMLISPMLHQGGFERVCITTARLMEPYFDVTIVIFNSANIAYDVKGLHIIDIQMGVKKGKLQKLFNIFRRSRKVKVLKKELQPAIAYSFGPSANLVNCFSKTKETKVWLGIRNYTDITEKYKMKLFTHKADLIIACAKCIEEELNQRYHYNKTATLYNLYDVEQIRKDAVARVPELPWEKKKDIYMISMGRDADQKGFWHMLKVFSLVRKSVSNVKLMILGAGTFNKYRQLAKDLQIEEDVFFAGMQTEPYIYLKQCEIYLLTSQNEGFPNALVEGMSLGLAAVSVDCKTGPSEILTPEYQKGVLMNNKKAGQEPAVWGQYGILLPDMEKEPNLDASVITQEEENMASAIVKLIQQPGLLQQYRDAALKRAQDFTYSSYVEQFLKLADR